MVPQSVKGFKKIEFMKHDDSKSGSNKTQTNQMEYPIIEEESKSQESQKMSFVSEAQSPANLRESANSGSNNMHSDFHKIYVESINTLYESTLEWMLGRVPSDLNESLMIDDSDKIICPPVLILCLSLCQNRSNLLKQRHLQDLQMLAKWIKTNSSSILDLKQFQPWLLNVLIPLQQSK